MRKTFLRLCSLALLCICTQLRAQDHDAMMKAWQAYMTPGEMHKMLASGNGEWTADITMWMDPNGQPTKSKGTMSNKMILGGRYQESHYTGDMMGQKMEGMGVTGYDNNKKQFETTWVDNMGTGVMKMAGTYDAPTQTITFTGSQMDPMTGKEITMKETLQFVDANNQVMTMYTMMDGGAEFKSMEIKFKKK